MRGINSFTVSIVILLVSGGLVVHTYAANGNDPSSLPISSGTVMVITTSEQQMTGGGMITASSPRFYGFTYNFEVRGHYILNGSWDSTGLTLVYLFIDNYPYLSTPVPDATRGVLNQTVWTGNYTLVIAGYPGDRIEVVSSIGIHGYVPYRVGSFVVPAGTSINSPMTYTFHLNKSAILIGSFTVGGIFNYALNGIGVGFSVTSYNSSSKPSLNSFWVHDSPPLAPGNYYFTFNEGTFYVNKTLEFVLYYDNSS